MAFLLGGAPRGSGAGPGSTAAVGFSTHARPTSRDFDPIFIVGSARSGTSTLAAILDRHDRVAIPPETQFFVHAEHAGRLRIGPDHGRIVDHFLRETHLWEMGLNPGCVLERFRGDEPTYTNFFRRALEEYASLRGKDRLGDKSVLNLFMVPQIFAAYPGARLLWLVRDGRDAVQAALRCGVFDTNRRRSSHFWRSAALAYFRIPKRYGDRIHTLHFEDLLRNPHEQVERICEFLGLEFQESMLDSARPTSSIPTKELVYKSRSYRPLDPSLIGEHDRVASVREKWLMDSVMAGMLRRMGYAPTNAPRRPLAVRAWDTLLNLPFFLLYDPAFFTTRLRAANLLRRLRRRRPASTAQAATNERETTPPQA